MPASPAPPPELAQPELAPPGLAPPGLAPRGLAPRAFHLMAKPTGAVCNLACTYCYFLAKEELYPGSTFRMSEQVLRRYLTQLCEASRGPRVTVTWQGGEPTLMGLEFFEHAVALAAQCCAPGQEVVHTIQTNATLIDARWADFFARHGFLVGVSVDGPQVLHDANRPNKAGRGSFAAVMRGLGHLKRAGVTWNLLTTVNARTQDHGLDIYRFERDELAAHHVQFIPIVERPMRAAVPYGSQATDRSVEAPGFGQFLIEVFDEWVRHDVGRVYVQQFDAALASWAGLAPTVCVHAENCGGAPVLEHTGDVYCCDHFVEPAHLLGNITQRHLLELVASNAQREFGLAKSATLPQYCRTCPVRFACNGGCPKDRFTLTPDGEPGLHYLCPSYRAFFTHIDAPMRFMAACLRREQSPAAVMAWMARRDARAQ